MSHAPFDLYLPERRDTSVIFASPHSGRVYPAALMRRTVLDERTIRSSEDAFVDRLIGAAPSAGAPVLAARAARAFVDLNRSSDELDPAVIEDVRGVAHNPRVSSGLGVVPRVVSNGRAIYRGKIPYQEARDRIEQIWRPYHARLDRLMEESVSAFGEAILIDMHSMPHEAIDSIAHTSGAAPEIVLGDRFGASARPDIVDRIEAACIAAGLKVVRNAPFAGAYTAQHYGRPSRHRNVVQLEIDRALYMNERTIQPNANYEAFVALMDRLVTELAAIGRKGEVPLAAE